MKILLFGSRGYLGGYFKTLYPDAICPSVDIADYKAVSALLDSEKPDVVINCAGKTGRPNVDWCEDHKGETVHSNVVGSLVLAEECQKRGIYLVHLGTGCVYLGDESTPFSESDPPNFFDSFYARTKGLVDQLLRDFPVLNIRLRMPFDGSQNERNLINKLVKYDCLIDVPNSMTYIPDLLKVVKTLIDQRAMGSFNVVNPGSMTAYRMMELYKEIVDPKHTFQKFSNDEMLQITKAGRSNCILSTRKLEEQGITLRPIQEAVMEALQTMKSRSNA